MTACRSTVAAIGVVLALGAPARAVTWETFSPNLIGGSATLPTLSGGNLTLNHSVASPTDQQGASVATGQASGQYHIEFAINSTAAPGFNSAFLGGGLALFNDYAALVNQWNLGVGFRANGQVYVADVLAGTMSPAPTAGDTIAIDIDLGSGGVSVRDCTSGGNVSASVSPLLGNGWYFHPAAITAAAGDSISANFGQSGFQCTVPGGYTAGWPVASPARSHLTYSPGNNTGIVQLLDGDLTTFSGPYVAGQNALGATSAQGLTGGKYFWFYTSLYYPGLNMSVGVSAIQSNTPSNYAVNSAWFSTNGGAIGVASGSAAVSVGNASFLGTQVQVAFDRGANLIWWKCTGCTSTDWNGNPSADPATGTGGLSTAALFSGATPAYPFMTGNDQIDLIQPSFGDVPNGCSGAPSGFTCGIPGATASDAGGAQLVN